MHLIELESSTLWNKALSTESPRMIIKRFSSIREIDETLWNSILAPNEFFNCYGFVEVVEQSKVEDAHFYYLLFYNNEELIGHTVLSSFQISLDMFARDSRVIQVIKKIFPNFFNLQMVFSGLPASFSQLNLKIKNPEWEEAVTSALNDEMEKLATDLDINLLCVKEFKGEEVSICKALLEKKFFQAFSLPYMKLDINWKSFPEYLNQLRHPYRRAIKSSLKKFLVTEPVIHPALVSSHSDCPVLVLGDHSLCHPKQLFQLYLSVMDRTPTKLETLNLAFFENLYERFAEKLEILTVQVNNTIISAALIIPLEDELTFMLVGHQSEKDEYDSYYNLVYGIIQLGIQRNVKKINLGQTAYWVKLRLGAVAEPVFLYVKWRKPFINMLLTRFNKLIFPELKLSSVRVFSRDKL